MTEPITIPVPAVSVVNGTKDSVIFLKIDSEFLGQFSDHDMEHVKRTIDAQLIGTCMEGARVIVTCGIDIDIATPEPQPLKEQEP